MMKVLLETKDKKIYWRNLTENDYDQVKNLIMQKVIKHEPVYAMLEPTCTDFLEFELPRLPDLLKNKLSIGAFDQNCLCGMSLISMTDSSHTKKSFAGVSAEQQSADVPENSFALVFSRFVNKLYDGFQKYTDNESYITIEESAVLDEYCRMGIMTALIKKVETIAKQQNCKKIFSFLTSKFTQNICEKYGYKILKIIDYSTYVDDVLLKNPFTKISDVHCSSTLVCLEL